MLRRRQSVKIYLEAFVDTNFGDNLFVHTVISRYPQHTFYLQVKEKYGKAYDCLKEMEPTIRLVDQDADDQWLTEMDGMLMVGGDTFGAGADYSPLLKKMRVIKSVGGWIAILGCSLFKAYSKSSWMDLCVLFSQADVVVVRERESYEQLRAKCPWANLTMSTDMAFVWDVTDVRKEPVQQGRLGISVRRKMEPVGSGNYEIYCGEIAQVITEHLNRSQDNQVDLLALSHGVYDDVQVAEDCIALCEEGLRSRITVSTFDGDVKDFIRQIQKCETLFCTRFHAMVFAILLDKPFVPVVYEEKMDRLLNELEYHGLRPRYGQPMCGAELLDALADCRCGEEALRRYQDKADTFFAGLDRILDDYAPNVLREGGKTLLYHLYRWKEYCFRR